jgi:hypothetical protein
MLTLNDVLSFGICKYIFLNNINTYYLLIPSIMYSFQITLFYYGLNVTSMAVLNIIWNLLSSILVTILGLFYFEEKITNLKFYAILLGLFSLFLFLIDGVI